MDKKEYGFKEQDIKNNFAAALKKTVEEAKPAFEASIPSAIDHTVSLLDTDVINKQIIQESLNQGQGNANEKTRVRTMDGPNPFAAVQSSQGSEFDFDNRTPNYSSYPGEEQNNWKMGGYTETLILLGTAALVVLVFMVTYLMLNYYG